MFNQVEPALSIRVNVLPDGTLTPHPSGVAIATVCFTRDDSGFKTGLLQFAGLSQASLNYDHTQSMIVGYSIMNHSATLADQQSIERLIHYVNANSHNALVVSI